jgi:cysteinyl-tRNA synthetase
MVRVILGLETAVQDWAGDSEEDQGTEQARTMLRSLIARLGQAAQTGLADPRDRLRPAVDPLLALRAALRDQGRYADADAIRAALAAAGLDIRDTTDGTWWQSTTG